MPAPLLHIESSPTVPPSADAVVIGAGVVGTFAAYYLARQGLRVALLEKGRVAGEQSSRNWGWCRQQNRDARELPMATQSLALWDALAGEIGEDIGFRRCGLLYLSNDERELDTWTRWCAFARGQGVVSHPLSAKEAAERGSATARRWKGGVFSPSDGVADPTIAVPLVARHLPKLGSTVHQMCAVRGIETAAGRVCGVVTETGTIRTSTVILAAGAWAGAFCRQLGVDFPQASVRASILAVEAKSAVIPDALHTAAVSVTRRSAGAYTLAISGRARVDPTPQKLRFARSFVPMFARRWRSLAPGTLEAWRSGFETTGRWRTDHATPMERQRILDPTPDERQIADTYSRAVDLLPALKGAPIAAAWAGYIDSTPDGVPAIGEVDGVPGLVLAAGFSGHGFGIGPGAGQLIAGLATGTSNPIDPQPYRPNRLVRSAWGRVAEF
ncbi:MAG: FAD-binding oxidoreductase [Alphaproteobacteria bacterium]|nr:FAD-binding oxidoreductase [Alphaproteobacteria bacterium]